MPHFPPNNFFFGNPIPNFTVSNDRVLDNLRVRQPNTMMVPPATQVLIDPNAPSSLDNPPLAGNNDPATNDSLRSGVAQAGALVYSTTPIANPLGPAPLAPVDGCFDNRNHLYFSDGKNWIPLANWLENDGLKGSVGPQYSEMYALNQKTYNPFPNWTKIDIGNIPAITSSAGFTNSGVNDNITWEGTKPIVAKVVASVSWQMADNQTNESIALASVGIGVDPSGGGLTIDPTAQLTQTGALNDDETDTGSPPLRLPYPRNVTVSGLISLGPGDAVNLQIWKESLESTPQIKILRANLSIVAL